MKARPEAAYFYLTLLAGRLPWLSGFENIQNRELSSTCQLFSKLSKKLADKASVV